MVPDHFSETSAPLRASAKHGNTQKTFFITQPSALPPFIGYHNSNARANARPSSGGRIQYNASLLHIHIARNPYMICLMAMVLMGGTLVAQTPEAPKTDNPRAEAAPKPARENGLYAVLNTTQGAITLRLFDKE